MGFPKKGHQPDYTIVFALAFLVVFGLVMLSSASSSLGKLDFNDTYYYLRHQIYNGLIIGIIGFLVASNFYYGHYKNRFLSIILLIGTLILLLLVFTPLGFRAGGATRWLSLGPITFQPAEFIKISLIIYLASWLSRRDFKGTNFVRDFMPFLIMVGLVSVIMLSQKSTTPVAILLLVALIMYAISGARWRFIAGTILVGIISLTLVINFSGYRNDRLSAFLNPTADIYGSGYHVEQAKTAIGAGGLTGVGYGQSTVKFRLPEPIGDSIFAVIAEEFGFIGTMLLIGALGFLVLRIFLLAKSFRDPFGQLLLVGFGSTIAIQSAVNIGAMSGLLPLTGSPLPFISYGGTALAVFMTIGGVIVNISKHSSR